MTKWEKIEEINNTSNERKSFERDFLLEQEKNKNLCGKIKVLRKENNKYQSVEDLKWKGKKRMKELSVTVITTGVTLLWIYHVEVIM